MPDSPIFLIGAARSGTKFLRDCLRADPRVAAVPYDINYIWRYGQNGSGDDRLDPTSIDAGSMRRLRQMIARQARWKEGAVLLEKTVSNSLRVPFVEAVFPGARYVHLVRDGRDVALSAMNEWAAPPDYRRLAEKLWRLPLESLPYLVWFSRKSLLARSKAAGSVGRVWGPRYPGITDDMARRTLAEVCAIQWQKSVEFARADLGALPADRVFEVRYEALVSDPQVIADLATALNLDSTAIGRTWKATVRPTPKQALSSAQKASLDQIEGCLRETLQAMGY
jgi:hypothetical protein